MKSNRLFQMIYLLLNHEKISAPALADQLDVSVRTVYRYVDDLSSAGVPVYVLQGRNGGIELLPGYKIDNTIVDKQEQSAILTALNGLKSFGIDNGSTLEKLSAIFHQQPVAWITIDPSTWSDQRQQKNDLAKLRDAIIHSHLINFNYLSAKNEYLPREVFPYQVIFKDKAWYLRGYSVERQADRLFKLSRIDHLQVSKKQSMVDGKRPWLTTRSSQQSTAIHQIPIQLHADAELKYRLFEAFATSQIIQEADGGYIVNTKINDDDWLITYLLSFGSHLKVVKPASLQQRMKQEIKKCLAQYKYMTKDVRICFVK
ncbi:MAG: YafY family transcriptional regulator [Furfurilactobacillus sp.]|uniref:YafY family transcriptional regulator n=2 Tax=Furfurilactobacillus milii TaxID=2888272 RepID=A0ABT6DA03_9LACO|nr:MULTISPECIES: YafY family protein [Furfurilactobacillus]QLE65437.1 transcription regulator [Furfurilactobacillus rossiae]MCF6160935.1 YafY family transcriptional regulator [Furfurilactobacillus milii]MCF6163299.1 YafY family transcriptional regulator [Furfurilactobacillus milii]MCH4011945.1 YafY family transcriptional regulator [Furfurilactobacillus sp.]MCH4037837.1 YafY family transcriptional regulator [Furfurilactobacillus sp.]